MNKFYIQLILFFFSLQTISCSRDNKGTPDKEALISVNVQEPGIGVFQLDSIRVFIDSEIPDRRMFLSTVLPEKEGKCVCRFPLINNPKRITMHIHGKRKGKRFREVLMDYLVEPGDSIEVVVACEGNSDSLIFSGEGSVKFDYKYKVDKINEGSRISEKISAYTLDVNKGRMSWLECYDKKVKLADSINTKHLQELNVYKEELEPFIYELLKAESIGYINKWLKINFWGEKSEMNDEEKSVLCYKMLKEAKNTDVKQEVMAMSPNYIKYLSDIGVVKLISKHSGQNGYDVGNIYLERFNELCAIYSNDYTGLLREKLLLFNLQSPWIQDSFGFNDCLMESLDLIRTPSLKKIFQGWYGKKIRGAEVYNFKLPDTTGNIIQLKNFRGKVVYVDIWFTGCGGCAALAEKVDEWVYPQFKNNPDVVFVSISLDKSRERWLKSVREEKYGLKEYINLYTGGLGLNEPFMRFYDIQGGPTTMLVDKHGKIYSATPPKHNDNEKMSGLISLINEALKD